MPTEQNEGAGHEPDWWAGGVTVQAPASFASGRCLYCRYRGWAWWPTCPYAQCASHLDLRLAYPAAQSEPLGTNLMENGPQEDS